MHRIGLVLIFSGFVPLVICQDPKQSAEASKAMTAPALPFYDWGACPFEGCSYRRWTARKPIIVYDTWKEGRRPIAQLSAGEKVIGVTSVVITHKPGVIRMDRDWPDGKLKRGDTILTYTYRGEGFSAVWFKGSYYSEFNISFTKWPNGQSCGGTHCAATCIDLGKKTWWAEIKLKSARTGWANMDHAVGDFDGVHLLDKPTTTTTKKDSR